MGVVRSFLGSDITCGCVTSHGVCDVILGVLRHMGVEGIYRNLISVPIRDQVSAGIVTEGPLYRGHNGEAGNIGTCPLADRYQEKSMQTVNQYVAEGTVLQRIMAYQKLDRVDVNRIRRD